jgi:hypothetical protein
MLRLIHNRPIIKYVLAGVGIVIALFFAWNFYPFGDWLGKTFLTDVPGASQTLGLICALALGGLVLLLLFHKEYMKEDTKAYAKKTGDNSFMYAFHSLIWVVMGLEFFSGLFRCLLLNWNKFSVVVFGIGLIGMGLTFIIGKLLHVQMNRPPSLAARRLRDEAGRQAFEDGERHLKDLSIGEKRQVANFDNRPLDDVRAEKARLREEEVAQIRKKQQDEEDDATKDEEMYKRMISPPDPTPPALAPPSSNGNKRPANF